MADTLSETEACQLLARLFRSRGFSIERNVPFREHGIEFHIDGWDRKARVGFEFLSSEDDDHVDLSLAEYQTLSALQQQGDLSLFVIDEVEPLSAADLTAAASAFLDEAAAATRARAAAGRRGGKKKPAAAKPRAATRSRPAAARKKTARKKKKPAGAKPAAGRKPAAGSGTKRKAAAGGKRRATRR